MAKVDLFNIKGENIGTVELKEEVFAIEPNQDVMWRYIDMQLTNSRAGTASTKTRGEVSGGGRKPWIQKHTGRARQGSIRAPHWRHGGVAHGPKPRVYFKRLNKKMKRLALKSALSLRLKENNLVVVDDIKFEKPRTKDLREVLKNLGLENQKVLIVLPKKESEYENVKISGRNIPGVKVLIADNPGVDRVNIDGLNVYDILNHDKLVLLQGTVQKIEEVLG
ncbi:50S ribosomal protein L4 [Thermosipho melanesiensis]|uniref:Large ribosomal subunit protein uL4 n=2 Tax=Thermosipho melanesiensis TaxID=46541 RepID=RL4_THEM4|nr:50S ribosomal protein L4 [Thermosipho melanesiensis]A6LLL4.1 RecName: Full=Large ribosomal subunit protein uL4; AltName: Full=50S ribosomal protein L4 [Thermosipho melanesiensis BI429]ABR30815.1 ribosomal protein L4/L1e [Thermosipho melanesiensis BI429]APT73935.1 50S ribosomal protein L4 [Thermosipho melanesiensis]OOC35872.1 50S ribosomal protein L4 [Thermosipho melanesiensis]OOC38374.1 50S ribosomal protein L4 [Thermosipho melanesiensis]OOC38835.1 50S ribosomal protein L4 [Thermosipho mel